MARIIISDLSFQDQIIEDLKQIEGGANAGAFAGAYEFNGVDFAGAISASDNGTRGEVDGSVLTPFGGSFGGNVFMN